MDTSKFMQGLLVAIDHYADECGMDGYSLVMGGKPDYESYKHVDRKLKFVKRVEQLLKDFTAQQTDSAHAVELSTPVLESGDVSEQMRQEKFDRIANDIRWEFVQRWWERDDFTKDFYRYQSDALGELKMLNPAKYQQILTAHGLTQQDVEVPTGYFAVVSYGKNYDIYAKHYKWTAFTKEEKAEIIRRYEKSNALKKAAHDGYINRSKSTRICW